MPETEIKDLSQLSIKNNKLPNGNKGKRERPGSPTKLPEVKEKINDPEVLKLIQEQGFTEQFIAKALGVSQDRLIEYKKKFPEFFETLKRTKQMIDLKVELSLFHRAMGYSHPDVHVSNYQGKVTVTPIIKHYPPDPTSMIFWLKNRKPEEWRDKQQIEFTGIDEMLLAIKKNKPTDE